MYNKTKKMLIIAGILVGVGVAIFVLGAALGGFRDGSIATGNYKIESLKLDEFENIDIDADEYEVNFVKGDSFKIDYKYNEKRSTPVIMVENNTLYFTSKSVRNGFNLDLLNIFDIGIKNSRQAMTIYCPSDVKIKEMILNLDLGSCCIENREFDSLDIDMDLGDLDLKNIKTNKLVAKLSLGDLDGENIISDNSVFEMDLGELYLDNISSKGLEANLSKGDLEIEGTLEGLTTVKLDLGTAEIRTELPIEVYSYNVKTDLGDCSVNGSKDTANSAINQNSLNEIEAKTSLGDLDLYFGK